MSEIEQIKVVAIVGSIRTGRIGATVANWFTEYACTRGDVDINLIDLIDFDLSHAFEETPGQITFCRQVDSAEAIVIVTPEYNHSFPGQLKTAIDCTDKEFAGKPVGFVSYGGLSGGLRAVEALRLVMAEVHAITIREAVSIHRVKSQFSVGGSPIDPERIEESATRMLDQLVWWATAARNQRVLAPYPG